MSKEEKEANELVPDQAMTTAVELVATNGIENNNEKASNQLSHKVLFDPQARQWNPFCKQGDPTNVGLPYFYWVIFSEYYIFNSTMAYFCARWVDR